MKLTPGMQQFMKIKNQHPDCIVLFRMGDFYETFFEDAKTAARELEITLTSRGKGETKAPLAGIPYHSIEPYISKLVKKGYKVAMVEQMEDPKLAKGLVKRDLVRIITPGTITESMILDSGANNYIVSFVKEKDIFGLSFCDMSTGEFLVTEISEKIFFDEIKRQNPSEIIFPMSLEQSELISKLKEEKYVLNAYDDRFYYYEKALESLKDHFNVLNLDGFGIKSELMVRAAGSLLCYMKDNQMNSLIHINKICQYNLENYMYLDNSTVRNLELLKNVFHQKDDNTLISVLDKTVTPMGKRLLRKWIVNPLVNKLQIEKRLDSITELNKAIILRSDLKKHLEKVYDMERLITRVSVGSASPKDLVSLKMSLKTVPKIKEMLVNSETLLLKESSDIVDLIEPTEIIDKGIKNEPNTIIREGNIIKDGYNNELDELRELTLNTKKYLTELEQREQQKTGIRSLKVRYNKIFGYYIEVTKANLHLVPTDYIRKQTQVNSERFITEELKEKEAKILGAQERIFELEYDLFIDILDKLKKYIPSIQDTSGKMATLDCLISLAETAQENNYAKPQINEQGILNITDGRHPVVEEFSKEPFIANSCSLNSKSRTMIITGPNMAGKSTYMRQIALISLLAQIGSYVPAKSANLPIVDRIFTRVGAYDDLVSGQSTFMVEMNETANILNNATDKSLIILDEIGRGTSTYDGLSLAWAIALHINNKIKAKTLFATHYHYLNKLAQKYEGINNYNISVNETEHNIIFLRKIVEGGTDKSYGIQVAKLAGIPQEVIDESKKIMNRIEMDDEIGETLHHDIKQKSRLKDMGLSKFLK
ncbi:MAG: DNA mismatch repair protein MutS [Nanoarchaeota archaeon]